MKVKLIRKQRYIIETHQEVEVDINDINEQDYDELFYDSPETIESADEQIMFRHPDNFDYVGYDILLDDNEYHRIDSYDNTLLDDLPNWREINKITLKDYLRNKKIEKLLNK